MRNTIQSLIFCIVAILGFSLQTNAQCSVEAFASDIDIICGEEVRLSAIGEGVTVFENDFNNCNIGTGWAATSQAQFNDPCGSNPTGSCYLWMGNTATAPRNATTNPLDLTTGGTICFSMRYAIQGQASPCEGVDLPDEGVSLQYSNAGGPWTDIAYYDPFGGNDPTRTVWNQYCEGIPTGARGSSVRLRWIQLASSNKDADHWGLENVSVEVNPPGAEYTWQHTGVTSATGDTDPVQPITNTTYTVEYKFGACTSTASVTVNVVKPNITVSKSPTTTVCPGQPVVLDVESELKTEAPSCGIAPDLVCSGVGSEQELVQVGAGTNVTTAGNCNGSPFGTSNCNGAVTTQYIFRAAELTAAGLEPGKITSLDIEIAAIELGSMLPRFKVWVACTNLNQFANGQFVQPAQLNLVYGPKNHPIQVGWNTVSFDNGVFWDGTSNLVVMFCYANDFGDGTTARTRDNLPGFNCSSQDGTNTAGTDFDFDCFDDTFVRAGTRRPNMKFLICKAKDIVLTYNWTPPIEIAPTNVKSPTSNPTQTRTYTATVNGQGFPAGCAVSKSITVNVVDIGAFSPSYNVGVCEGEDLKLDAGITGMTTYSWTGPGGYTSNQEKPTRAGATTAMNGTYTVTVDNGSCTGTKSVDVTVGVQPVPGGTYNDVICQTETAYALESNLGAPFDATATWTSTGANNGSIGLSGKTLNATRLTTVPGDYTFTRSVTNACGTKKVDVSIRVEKEPLAGGDKTTIVCKSSGVNTLFDKLAKDANNRPAETGGVWTDVTGVGAAFNAATGEVDVSGLAAGMYDFRYTQTAVAPCVDASAVVTLNVIANPNAGGSDTVQVCADGTSTVDLFTVLTGSPDAGGDWVAISPFTGGATLVGGVFDPANSNAGVVRFRYEITTPGCPQSSTEIGVDVVKPLTPGGDKTTTVCNSSSVITLFDKLGKDANNKNANTGGTWTDVSGVGAAFDAASGSVNVNGFAPNDYEFRYEVPAVGPCPASSAVVTLHVLANPVTGGPDTLRVCADGSSTVDLFTVLTGTYDLGGTWSALSPFAGGATLTGSVFDPQNSPTNRYTFKYEINTPGCPVTNTKVAVEVQSLPNPGIGQDGVVCDASGVIDLKDFIRSGSSTPGTWTETTSIAGSAFDPVAGTVDVTNLGGETLGFQFEVNGVSPCSEQSTSFEMVININPTAGADVADTICTDLSNVDLNDFLTDTATLGGKWIEISSSGGVLDTTGFFNSTGVAEGEYTFQYSTTPSPTCFVDVCELKLYVRGYPIFSQVAPPQCSQDRTTYDVELTVAGGDASSYSVNQPGAFVSSPPNVFVSDPITSGAEVVFEVTDQYGCGAGDATVKRDCDCKTDAGQLDITTQSLCDAVTANFNYLGGFSNDSNDTYQFVIFDAAVGLSSILERSKTPSFTFDESKGYVYGKQYVVAVIAGDSTAAGDVILTDACLSVSQTAKVTWHALPMASVSISPLVICPGDTVVFDFTLTQGAQPYEVAYFDGATNDTIKNISSTNKTYQTPPLTASTTYTFSQVKDVFGCVSNIGTSISVDVNQSSSVSLNTPIDVCENPSTPVTMSVDITGPGSTYEVWYTNLLTNTQTKATGLASGSNVSISGLLGNANAAVSYRLDTVIGNVPSICPAFTQGVFTINPIPTIIADATPASDVFCENDANVLLDINLTGIGPWQITVPNNGLGNVEVVTLSTASNTGVAFAMPLPGTYTYNLDVVDLGSSLSCAGTTQSVTFTVNETPEITASFDLTDAVVCEDNAPQVVNFVYNRGTVSDYEVTGFTILSGGASSTVPVNQTTGGVFNIPQPMAPGNYVLSGTVREKNAPNCLGTFVGDNITVKALPTVVYDPTHPNNTDTICVGNAATLRFNVGVDVNVDPTNTVRYNLQGDDGSFEVVTGQPGGSVEVSITPLTEGTISYRIFGITDEGTAPNCSGIESTFTIEVLPAPEMNLSDSYIEVCEGTMVDIPYDVSGTGLITGVLTEQNGKVPDVTLNKITGSEVVPLALVPGDYVFTIGGVKDNTVAGCPGLPSTLQTIVVVRELPRANIQITPEVCEGDLVTLTINSPAGAYTNGPFTYTVSGWNPDGSPAVFPNVTDTVSFSRVLPVPGGNITLTKIEDSSNPDGAAINCFIDTALTLSYTINELPRVNLFGEDNICEGEIPELTMDVTSGVGSAFDIVIETFPANNGEVYFETVTMGRNVIQLIPAPTQSRYYTISSITDQSTSCVSTYGASPDASVTVNPLPLVDFTSDITESCPPLEMVYEPLVSSPDGIQSVVWDFGDGTQANDRDTIFKSYAYTGLYSPSLTATTISGCIRTVTKEEYAQAYSVPIPTFSLKETRLSVFSPVIRVDNHSSNAVTYNWDFGGYGTSTEFEPEFLLVDLENGFANVCLEAITLNGCVDTTCQIVEVVGEVIINVPNTFTPDGDGINDGFKPIFKGALPNAYEMLIFDRWGKEVFSTRNPNTPWYGLDKKGDFAQDGVYVYRIELKSRYSAEKVIKVGNINLFR